jgi:hypothetical protein
MTSPKQEKQIEAVEIARLETKMYVIEKSSKDPGTMKSSSF